MMEPVLEKMGEDFEGQLDVEFINIAENRAAAEKYGVRVIPTQVFFGPSGEEIARHEGFMGREDILRTFEENGVKIPAEDDSG
jgi:thioredoxin 1